MTDSNKADDNHVRSGQTTLRKCVDVVGMLSLVLFVYLACACTTTEAQTTVTVTATGAALSPVEVVRFFYEKYMLYPGNPLVERTYAENPVLAQYLSAALIEEIEDTLSRMDHGGYDPFLCAQDNPNAIDVIMVASEENTASVLLHRLFGTAPDPQPVQVTLERISGKWLMVDVSCGGGSTPQPEGSEPSPPVLIAPLPAEILESETIFAFTDFGFQTAYPPAWQVQWLESYAQPGDPVVGYALFFTQAGPTPLTVVVISGSEEEFRTFFPEPSGGSIVMDVHGMQIHREEPVPGEVYYFSHSPYRPEQRVALRLIDRDGDLDEGWYQAAETMLATFSWQEAP